ncbi:MAG: S8 family peptidase [Muribaculaceae bacterium]|nr:S8 family peptidase [Muribaculaceae bacterium]
MRQKLLILALAAATIAQAQNTLDLESRMALHRMHEGINCKGAANKSVQARRPSSKVSQGMSLGFIKLSDGATVDSLIEQGVEVYSRRGNILIASFPTEKAEAISGTAGVVQMQLSRDVQPQLDIARSVSGVDKIHSGLDLPQSYTGKGVVCGIVDAGLDPNHVNFKDASGNPRIKSFAYRRPNDAGTTILTSTYTPEQLPQFSTDDATTYHGTHTLGIMAGSYRGDVRLVKPQGVLGQLRGVTEENPYYGVAYEADIAASCGRTQDAFVAYGVEGILDYAYNEQKPAVINLSLGSALGPHDGNSMFSQYLELASEEAIICVSAGNYGDLPLHISKTFSEGDTELQTFIFPYYYGPTEGNVRYDQVQIYSNDDTEFDVQGLVYSKTRDRVSFRMPISGNTGGVPSYYVSSSDYGSGVVAPQFAKAFDGYFGLGSMIHEETGRFYALADYFTIDNQENNSDGTYLLGLLVTGKPGQRIDIYCEGYFTYFTDEGIAGWTAGSCDGTISDVATSRGCVAVGSYDTRDSWYSLDNNAYSYEGYFEEGTISEFSGYGTLADGRALPHVCAPGATIISSTSTPYVSYPSNYITNAYLQASADNNGRTDYWQQSVGTSMSSPFVAGAIALWLEADPTLTSEDVIDIIQRTSTVDDDVLTTGNSVQWGAGKFNAYAGLKEVLRNSGLSNVAADRRSPIISALGNRCFQVVDGGAAALDVSVCDMSGRVVLASKSEADELTIDLGNVATGVYIVNVNGIATKLIVK